MSELPDRFIKLGDEKWRNVKAFEFPWSISQKGNPYVSLTSEEGIRVTVSVHKVRERWTFSVLFGPRPGDLQATKDEWHSSGEYFDDIEAAKRAALESLGVIKRREPVARVDERDDSDNDTDERGLNRRIRL